MVIGTDVEAVSQLLFARRKEDKYLIEYFRYIDWDIDHCVPVPKVEKIV